MIERYIFLILTATLGIAQAIQTLSPWLSDDAAKDDFAPWGSRTLERSHPTKDMPDTNVTRFYDLHISKGSLSPDGVAKEGIMINGGFPGPLLEANWGDWFEVTVYNEMDEGTSIHYHGINQMGTPWADGVPFASQCPIAPGSSLTYRFRADEIGTSWYHAHFSAQYTSGAVGPLVIHGPSHVEYDVDLSPILISDWYHEYYSDLVAKVVQNHAPSTVVIRPLAENNLVAGSGIYPCANVTNGAACTGGSYATINFEPGKKYRLRLINTGTTAFEKISIDGHAMQVIAYDFVAIQPYQTNVVTLSVGQRADVIVTASGKEGDSFWFRAWNDPSCADAAYSDGRAIIRYSGSDPSTTPPENPTPLPENKLCANDDLYRVTPVYVEPAKEPDVTIELTATVAPNGTGAYIWKLNDIEWKTDLNDPPLLDVTDGRSDYNWAAERHVYNLGSNNTLRIVFINTFIAPHAMHLHGHDFQILAEGQGKWDGTITNQWNPTRKDVHVVRGGANSTDPSIGPNYTVFQIDLNNPGVWLFHCHLAWHLSAGMGMMFVEQTDELYHMNIPKDVRDTCTSWTAWQKDHATDVIDARRR